MYNKENHVKYLKTREAAHFELQKMSNLPCYIRIESDLTELDFCLKLNKQHYSKKEKHI